MPVTQIAPSRGMSQGECAMSEQEETPGGDVPMMQKLLDNPFLLLFLGVATPAVLYLGWGIMEIVTIPTR